MQVQRVQAPISCQNVFFAINAHNTHNIHAHTHIPPPPLPPPGMAERVKVVGGTKDVLVGWKELAQINLKARQQV